MSTQNTATALSRATDHRTTDRERPVSRLEFNFTKSFEQQLLEAMGEAPGYLMTEGEYLLALEEREIKAELAYSDE